MKIQRTLKMNNENTESSLNFQNSMSNVLERSGTNILNLADLRDLGPPQDHRLAGLGSSALIVADFLSAYNFFRCESI